ncbi:DNA replication/repair protein RecF [Cardiobacteriaceae bacterium TAE3-ERU3]|nr:DNA replication/repair protein RecF [Cardiobacteriaceae bacterium TAE3-ERU3]
MTTISRLHISGLRNLDGLELHAHPHINHIHGANGAGKTALLEALYILGRGRSFRSSKTRHIISHDHDYYRLIAHLERNGDQHLLGIERHANAHQIRLDGEDLKSLGDLASLVPIQIINSDHFSLIDQGPEHRRRFIDFGLFYHDANFLPQWQRYQHALKSRNAALRDGWANQHIRPWHAMLDSTANHIDQMRHDYLTQLEAALNGFHAKLGGLQTITIHYQRGWHQDKNLRELLDDNLDRDRLLKHTRDGIHRADLRFHSDGHDIAHHYSRGQQKTLISALILAQARLIAEASGQHPIMLVDDLAAELDPERQNLLLNFLYDSGAQLFITSITPDLDLGQRDHHILHLDNGRIISDAS